MAPRRPPFPRRENVNDAQAPPTPQDNGPLSDQVTNAEFRTAITMLSKVVTNQGIVASPNVPTPASRVRDFTRMNPPEFHGSKVDEDPQEFIDEVYKIVSIMGVTLEEKAELAVYQLKCVAQLWYTQWKSEKVDEGPVEWKAFKLTFLDHFFPLELREAKVLEFINLRQGNMGMRDYALKFTMLSQYAPSMVADPRAQMSKFILGVSDLVSKECRTTMLVKEMNISRLLTFAKQIKGEKLKQIRMRDSKRARYEGGFSNARTVGSSGRSHQGQSSRKKFAKDRVPYPKAQGERGVNTSNPSPLKCAKCGRNHGGKCLIGMGACYGCGKIGHKRSECPLVDNKVGYGRPI
ncbi:uncharacterized protein LOC129887455 [Solanum dulcamara]|uniref:uncharacterized protein LOC129887455 n=1 Tax=Solanum dulcamara TaxID=45834 RepID=UPI00248539A5|nr:uncharacterized protein LOC129887455 [Solanum dulcamara]XP_055818540.1 uncharacterized protein LOC129887455 [Solanum dulcamara]